MFSIIMHLRKILLDIFVTIFVVESVTPIFKVEFSKHHRASDRKFLSAVMFLTDQIISKNTYTQGNIQKKIQLQTICP